MKKYLAVAGNMGAGKTSMVEFVCQRYGFEPVYEPYTTNPYLDDFYQDMGTWAFRSQLWFLTHKFRLHRDLNVRASTVVQDRTIYEDAEIFCTNLYQSRFIAQRDYRTYMDLYEVMRGALQPPDLLVYLRCSVRAIRTRVRKRGRPAEMAIPAEYLRKLNVLYDAWIARYDLSPVVVWDSERMDYVSDLVARIEFQKALEKFV